MRIGFYAPLKAPDHPNPSGDRQMARQLMAALGHAGHVVDLYSRFRAFSAAPDVPLLDALRASADREMDRVGEEWADAARRPDLLFTYHLYYKAPDLLGPALSARFGLPYVTAEASLSEHRASGPWAARQALVASAVHRAALNLCFTARDKAGLAGTVPPERLLDLLPFIDATVFAPAAARAGGPVRLVTVAMMRPGDKSDSYAFLAAALAGLGALDWHLTIVGDGPARPAVAARLAGLPAERVRFMGALASEAIPALLRQADILVWPGFNEAFGVTYLEAQASGLPVVAVRNAGTPSVICDGETGLLTEPDPAAYAAAIARLIGDTVLRERMAAAALRFVHGERSLPVAAATIDAALRPLVATGIAARPVTA